MFSGISDELLQSCHFFNESYKKLGNKVSHYVYLQRSSFIKWWARLIDKGESVLKRARTRKFKRNHDANQAAVKKGAFNLTFSEPNNKKKKKNWPDIYSWGL